jgi:hypothetical protein
MKEKSFLTLTAVNIFGRRDIQLNDTQNNDIKTLFAKLSINDTT